MIKIVSDSSTLYSVVDGIEKGVDISPLTVTIGNKTYKEYEEINTDEFIQIINEGNIPTSSQPAMGDVLKIYEKYQNDEILNITIADGLSGTYNTASAAKNLVEHSNNITVLNSKTLCGPHRYLVDLAVELSKIGKSKEEIIHEINKLVETSSSFIIPNDFEYLIRGGRVSNLVGKISSVIKIVPVMALSKDGTKLQKFTTKRTFQKAILKICEKIREEGVDSEYKIYLSHACNEELVNVAKKIIINEFKECDIEIHKLSPVFTTQGGPGCIAIQTIKKHNILK